MQRLSRVVHELEVDLHRLRIAMEDGGTDEMRRDVERLILRLQHEVRSYCEHSGLEALLRRTRS